MEQALNRREWVDWLTRVRLLLIALILGVGVVWPQYVPAPASPRYFLPIVILWITIGILHLILVRLLPDATWLGGLQVSCDVVMITGIVYTTGLQDSYFTSLYLLVIIVASILFSRQAAFLTAALCLGALGLFTGLVHSGRLAQTSVAPPTLENLRMWLLSNSFGFLAIAYLSSLLAQSLRSKSSELEEKREELLELQDFTSDIIHSMRGGLVTTDLDGRVVLLNRTGEEILGRTFTELRGRNLREVSEEFWQHEITTVPEKLSLRREIEVRIPGGQKRYLGISVSPLRTRDAQRSGYVFNFQDLTELRRLEQELKLSIDGEMVTRFEAKEKSAGERDALNIVRLEFERAGIAPPSPDEMGTRLGIGPDEMRELMTDLLREKVLVRLGSDSLCADRKSLETLAKQIRALPGRELDIAMFKQLTGVSRKYAIPLLEYLDREWVTVKRGDRRLIL